MRTHYFRPLLTLALAISAQPALAFLDPPYIAPPNPSSSELISVNIYGGGCDYADGGVVWPPPVSREGNELRILLTGGHEEDPEFCYFGVGTFTAPVGVYPEGEYTLRVDWRYSTFNGWVTETLGVIPFTVTGTPPQTPLEAPTLNLEGIGSLLLALIASVLHNLRSRLT
jgi:hypothetical protein